MYIITTAVFLSLIIMQAHSAPRTGVPGVISTNNNLLKTPVNMSQEELRYLLKARRGDVDETQSVKTLTPCARAILGCCNAGRMNQKCSEDLSCGALFFDVNPCDESFIILALSAAEKFYVQFNKVD